jgi:hypothetical protein
MIPNRCTKENPAVACASRRTAVQRGTMWYSVEGHGWMWSLGRSSFPDPWKRCPFCDGALPTLTDAAERLLSDRQYDPYGEDGG